MLETFDSAAEGDVYPVPGPTMTYSSSITEAEVMEFRTDDLRRVVEIYLAIAYPSELPPEQVRRRLEWLDGDHEWLNCAKHPFEPSGQGSGSPVASLRLGNDRYPHMKLQVQPWPTSCNFLVSVNTHDQVVAPQAGTPEADAFRALQEENQRIKAEIEAAWDEAGLPTFLRYLRDYIESAQVAG